MKCTIPAADTSEYCLAPSKTWECLHLLGKPRKKGCMNSKKVSMQHWRDISKCLLFTIFGDSKMCRAFRWLSYRCTLNLRIISISGYFRDPVRIQYILVWLYLVLLWQCWEGLECSYVLQSLVPACLEGYWNSHSMTYVKRNSIRGHSMKKLQQRHVVIVLVNGCRVGACKRIVPRSAAVALCLFWMQTFTLAVALLVS